MDGSDDAVRAVMDGIRELDLTISHLRAEFAHRYRLSGTDSHVISVLATSTEPVTPTEVSRQLAVSSGTLTNIVDRLEASKLVQRVPNPHDRRSVMLQLTELAISELANTESKLRAGVTKGIAEVDLATFAVQLAAIADAMRTPSPDTGAGRALGA